MAHREGCRISQNVFFDEQVHMLDVECFTYLNRALESPLSPVVVVATNRGVCTIRGTDVVSSHGVPVDLLDRLLIIRTQPYSQAEIQSVSVCTSLAPTLVC